MYTKVDRIKQLKVLSQALGKLVPIAEKYVPNKLEQYKNAIARTAFLLKNGFTQDDLSSLSRSVPDVFDRHRDWKSEILEQKEDGSWCEPDWFTELEKVLQPVLEAAGMLRQLGYY